VREVDPRLPVLSTGVCVQVNIKDDADEDLVEYINTLRVSILEAYTGIMQGLKEAKKQEMVLPAIDAIRDLLQVMILPLLPLMAFLWVWPPHALSASPAPLSLSLSLSLSLRVTRTAPSARRRTTTSRRSASRRPWGCWATSDR